MDQVFAPWRIEWIRREDDQGDDKTCVFCELPGRDSDRENRIVARSDHAFVLLNNAPYNPGHVMVIPYAHTGDYTDLSDARLLDHARLKQRTLSALESAFEPAGFNTGLNLGDGAGGSIDDHLHTHVVPRWQGDTNFMPVVGDTKVIVEALEETYDHLHEAFAGQDGATVSDENEAVVLDLESDSDPDPDLEPDHE
ncbi:HIT domain-containing protein [Halomontanus rarus]|uniref:HIT domain-containing protein n=1 Tax=Halomontanus rarus TaxID=3034020 RepID=UPI001A998B90